jgi:hypothetical protein
MMSWLNKLKGIFKEDEGKVALDGQVEEVSLEQLYLRVPEKINEQKLKKESVKKEILDRIGRLETETSMVIEALEKVDLSKKKEHEKIKLVVTENLNLYVSLLKKLIGNVKSVADLEVEVIFDKLSFYFNDFSKTSYAPFEKTTILVGNEMEAAKDILKDFVKDLNKINENNRPFFDEVRNSESLNSLLSGLKQNEDYMEELNKKISELGDGFVEEKERHEGVKNRIEEVKKSEDYKKDFEEKEKHRKKLVELEKEIEQIKEKIDLKLLSRHLHYNEKKNQMIKDYSKDFRATLINDENLAIAGMIREVHGSEILELKELRSRIQEANKPFVTNSDEEIVKLEGELSRLEASIKHIEGNIDYENNRKEKLAVKKEKTLSEIEEMSKALGLKLKLS